MTSRVKKLLLTAAAFALIACVPAPAFAKTACTASRPALAAAPHAGTVFTVSGVVKPRATPISRTVVKISLLVWSNGDYRVAHTYRATLSKNPAGVPGARYSCRITISAEGWHAVRALHYRGGKLVAKSKIAYFDVVANAVGQQIAVDSDSHATVTAVAGEPIDVVFHSASGRACGRTVHFLSSALTKTCSGPLTFHSDGLPAGSYAWQCNMGVGCCSGTLVVQDPQQVAIDSDSHTDVTALAGKPIDVVFHSPSAKMCGKTVHFLDPAFTKTSSDPLTYHCDGLAAGSYAWQCDMGPQCCGGNLILQ